MKKANTLKAAVLLLLLACHCAAASDLAALAESPEWRAILHFPPGSARSYVDDPRYFLNPSGAEDPLAELRATIAAVAEDRDTVCRYPDRYLWLKQHQLMPHWDLSHCEEFQAWRGGLDVDRVVLVFASSYLNSPSSMYGHTFLRLDPAGDRRESAYLSYALNFGASIPSNDNGLLYAYRGLFGGYPGLFTMQPYYEKIQEYTRLENRDMWEYELNLDDQEIERLLAHTWALRNINFAYYFFDENCSFRLLELLEVARPGIDLTSPFRHAAMPVDTVRQVVAAGLVKQAQFRASRHRELEHLLSAMTAEQKQWVLKLAEQADGIAADGFQALDVEAQGRITLAAYRYLRYRTNKQQRSESAARNSMQLLRAVRSYGFNDDSDMARPVRPDDGHKTSLLSLSVGQLESKGYTDLDWRISYHDALDGIAGYPVGASLAMGKLGLRWGSGEGLELRQFEPVAIRSLAPRNAFYSPLSWQVSGGVERLFDAPDTPLVTQINGGAGGSWSLVNGTAYSLLSARLEYNDAARQEWRLAPGLRIGQLWQGQRFSGEISGELFEFWGDGLRKSVAAAGHWQFSENQALRLQVQYRHRQWGESMEYSLSWRHYF